jgi:hypothetical protein
MFTYLYVFSLSHTHAQEGKKERNQYMQKRTEGIPKTRHKKEKSPHELEVVATNGGSSASPQLGKKRKGGIQKEKGKEKEKEKKEKTLESRNEA